MRVGENSKKLWQPEPCCRGLIKPTYSAPFVLCNSKTKNRRLELSSLQQRQSTPSLPRDDVVKVRHNELKHIEYQVISHFTARALVRNQNVPLPLQNCALCFREIFFYIFEINIPIVSTWCISMCILNDLFYD